MKLELLGMLTLGGFPKEWNVPFAVTQPSIGPIMSGIIVPVVAHVEDVQTPETHQELAAASLGARFASGKGRGIGLVRSRLRRGRGGGRRGG